MNVVLALLGAAPLVLFFVLLGVFKLATHWCAAGALALAALIAWLGFGMSAAMVGNSALYGLAFGITPILLIVIAAVWLYNLTVVSGRSDDVRAVFAAVGKGDIRIQALLVGFSFCGLLEGLAGFGAPVAIVAAMLLSFGIPAIKAAITTMVGNAISVAFGAMAIPVTTAAAIGGVGSQDLARTIISIVPIIAFVVPFAMLVILDGARGLRQLWYVALIQGAATVLGQVVSVCFISYELTSVLAPLVGFGVTAAALVWLHPTTPEEWRSASTAGATGAAGATKLSPQRTLLALAPYALVVVVFAVAKLWRFVVDVPAALASTDIKFGWPGLYGKLLNADGSVSTGAIFSLQTLSHPATMIALTALIVCVLYARFAKAGAGVAAGAEAGAGAEATDRRRFTFGTGIRALWDTIWTLRWSLLTIALVMCLAYVMNFSGQTAAIGSALASTGAFFAFLSPILGWLGTAVTGSATSSNALFASMQSTAGAGVGVDPSLLLAANDIGGPLGKIISPQNLAIAATAIEKPGCEAELLRKATPWSLGLLLMLCVLILLASLGVLPVA